MVQQKSYAFALRIIKAYRYLGEEKKEFVLANNYYAVEHPLAQMWKKPLAGKQKKIFTQN